MSLKAVFLDVGDTLLHEVPSRFAVYAAFAREHGADVDEARMKSLMRSAHHELPLEIEGSYRYSDPWFRAFIAHIFRTRLGLEDMDVDALAEALFERFEDADTFRIYPGARELLAELRASGLVIGVVSNWSARLPRLLHALELDTCFDFVLCSALERMEKPEPAIFRTALERAGVSPAEALHAGDHLVKDVRGARALGIQAVLVDHAGIHAEGYEEPAPRVAGLPELASYILDRSA